MSTTDAKELGIREWVQRAIETTGDTPEKWQTELAPGDHALFCAQDGLLIYAKMLEPGCHADTAKEKARLQKLYAEPHMANLRYTESFSPMGCEFGDQPVDCAIAKLTEDQFAKAKAAGWPQTTVEIYATMGAILPFRIRAAGPPVDVFIGN